jgi:hypothetical protein
LKILNEERQKLNKRKKIQFEGELGKVAVSKKSYIILTTSMFRNVPYRNIPYRDIIYRDNIVPYTDKGLS